MITVLAIHLLSASSWFDDGNGGMTGGHRELTLT